MRLFIAEKSSLGKAIAEALGTPRREGDSGLVCNNGKDIVTWAAGHILRLAQPHEVNESWLKWSLEQLPMLPARWKKLPLENSLAHLKAIKSLLPRASEVVNAGDADREGQLLIDEILEYLGCTVPVKRLLVTDTTPEAIRKSIAEMKDNAEYALLRDSAMARERTDWLLGMNMSRLYTIRGRASGGNKISLGRVQTPTLGLVVNRDKEIENFVSKPYWQLSATLKAEKSEFKALWFPGENQNGLDEEGRLVQESVADSILKELDGKTAVVQSVKNEQKTTHPPLPHSLPTLQIACSKKYDLSAAETLETLQSLYESGITTYPRSDCQYLPCARAEEASRILGCIYEMCPDFQSAIEAADTSRRTAAWNDKKVAEHFAVIPTGKVEKLEGKALLVFTEVARQYLAQFAGDHVYMSTEILLSIGDERFRSTGKQIVELGWRLLFTSDVDDDSVEDKNDTTLPPVAEGATLPVATLEKIAKKTTPPKHFTEATLLQAMNGIYKYVTDPEIRKTLREVDGIGTAATQASIIEKILARGYVKKIKKNIVSQPLGQSLIASVSRELSAPDFTAVMEQRAKQICEKQLSLDEYMSFITDLVKTLVADGKSADLKIAPPVAGDKSVPGCPLCKAPMRRWKSKTGTGYYWRCTNRDCGLIINDVKGHPQKVYPCPECKVGVLRLIKGKYGPFWGCSNRECHKTFKDIKGKPQL